MRESTAASDGDIVGEHRVRVRFGECDPMGIVYHPNYLVWFHEARDALLVERNVDLAAIEKLGYRFPVSDISCRYVESARFRDEVTVITRVKPEPVARMRFRFEALRGPSRTPLAKAEVVLVVTDAQGRLLLRLPEELRRLVNGAAVDDVEAHRIRKRVGRE